MMEDMRTAIVSLIYKEKGMRHHLKYYRPIAVASVVYRILARAVVIALRPLLPHVISIDQSAFQEHKLISTNTRLVQDIIHYCNEEGTERKGLLLFCDQDNAYPRVEWDFMFAILETMNMPSSFVDLVRTMYRDVHLQFKVNGVTSRDVSTPTNGVAQGCPLSPLLYLLYFQTFLSLLKIDTRRAGGLRGVRIPGARDGDAPARMVDTSAFADDLCVGLADSSQIERFRENMLLY